MSSFKLPLPCRGLRFIQILLQSLADGEKDENNPNLIRANVVKAYEQALKRYHGWIVQRVFSVRKSFSWSRQLVSRFLVLIALLRACLLQAVLFAAPYRSSFFKALSKGEEASEEDCLAKVRQFLENYTPTVDAIYDMYTSLNAELDYTV